MHHNVTKEAYSFIVDQMMELTSENFNGCQDLINEMFFDVYNDGGYCQSISKAQEFIVANWWHAGETVDWLASQDTHANPFYGPEIFVYYMVLCETHRLLDSSETWRLLQEEDQSFKLTNRLIRRITDEVLEANKEELEG